MNDELPHLIDRRLRTPRAAAIAGILFSLLLTVSVGLIRISIPEDPADGGRWLEEQGSRVALALSLAPFAGIAFLWFIGVVRDRIGHFEDRFFSSVFLGSGLLYLAMMFVSAGLSGSLLTTYAIIPEQLVENGIYTFGRVIMWRISNVYAIRMAGVFMISLGTISVSTHIMPRWLAFVTYGLALVLLLTISYSLWVTLIFPAWVLMISVYILVSNLRSKPVGSVEDALL